jgi:type IV secretory pathway VirJ component
MRIFRVLVISAVMASTLIIAGSGQRGAFPGDDGSGEAASAFAPITEQSVAHGRFQHVVVYIPHGPPRGFVMLLSGAEGWSPRLAGLARRIAELGAMVAGIDLPQFEVQLQQDAADCVFPDGDLENLSHFVQAYYRLPTYLLPILAGDAAGGTLAYAVLAQSPANTFAGAVSLGFCPSFAGQKHLCKSGALDFNPHSGGVDFLPAKQLNAPWVVLEASTRPADAGTACDAAGIRAFAAEVQGAQWVDAPQSAASGAAPEEWPPSYAAAFARLVARNAPPSTALAPHALADLPLVFVAPQSTVPPSDTFAILLSGDGGWAGLDKDVAAALAADGISVVGLDSLRYFWTARTPQGLAADLDRMIRYYLAELGKRRVVVIGYSQGADVLPFAINRLPSATRSHIVLAAIMGMSEHALFEFHMTSWMGDDNSGPATLPEVEKLTGTPVLCVYGDQESDSLCPKLDPHKIIVLKLRGGHHFDGNYAGLARAILAAAR